MNCARQKSTGFAILALALLLLFSFSHARVLINNPSYGQQLEILVENEEAPANATLIAPNGERIAVPFEGSQLRYPMRQSGAWQVEVGGRRYSVSVLSPVSPPSNPPSSQQESLWPLYLMFAAVIGIILSAVSVYFLFMRPPKQIPPILEKKREGDAVRIRLSAGTLPLSEIMLEDEVGKGWKGGPKQMARAKLEAGQVMELSYAWSGQLGEVAVRFLMDELPFELRVTDGIVILKESDATDETGNEVGADTTTTVQSSPAAQPKKSLPHAGRKLSRRKD
ncbi:Uncharacterised protein [uncultured archaeon]|nr:Uncharacterised protein [uncultured archaeon]